MKIGEKETLTATVFPEGATGPTVIWESSDELIATVVDGAVTGKSEGTATITAKAGEQSATCTVIVSKIPVSSITINGAEPTLVEGDTLILTATITPSDASYKTVTWTSSNGTVATVDQNGKVTAKSVGTAKIKATADGVTAECTITVEEKVIAVDSITLNKIEAEIFVGAEEKLTATVLPEDATNKDVTWTSSDTTIATVDSNGKVTAKSVGTAIITAKAGDKSATCTITVKPIIAVTKVSITPPDSTKIKYGEAIDLVATVEPEDATNKNVTWTSSDTTVATVDQNGRVAAQNKAGTVTITVTTEDGGKTATCDITVEERSDVIPVINITLNETNKTINKGNSYQLTATFNPTNATNKIVNWSSSDPEVATVDVEGNVRAVGGGTATITATSAENAEIKATCEVTVYVPVTGVKLNKTELRLAKGTRYQLIATVEPEDATNKNVIWSYTNSNAINGLDQDGNFTAGFSGQTGTVAVRTEDGEFADICNVTVYTPVESVSIDNPPTELAIGETLQLEVSAEPYNANEDFTWSSNKPEVATVNGEGFVTGVSAGEVTITVTTNDSKKTSECKITVKHVSVDGISLDKSEASLKIGDTLPLAVIFDPKNATNKNITWTSDNPSIATVDSEGKVTAVSSGTATIKVDTEEGGKTATCLVHVTCTSDAVYLNKTEATLNVGGLLQLEATVSPEGANQKVTWSSSNAEVATVDTEGKVIAQNIGEATITATADGGQEAICKVTVGNSNNDGVFIYSFNDGSKKATIVGYKEAGITGNGGKVTIPAEYMGYEVTRIEANTFKGCTALTELTIEGSVDIGSLAFKNCTKLGSVNLGENVTAIRNNAFEGCSSLNEIVIPNSVTSIGSDAFRNCSNLTDVKIGSGIVYAADASSNAFLYCPITNFSCDSTDAEFDIWFTADVYEKMYAPENLVIADFYTSIENSAFDGHKEKLLSVDIKATEKDGKWKGVEEIGDIAFANCSNLTRVVIPDSVTSSIDQHMFLGCNNLKYVTIGKNVPTINQNTFKGFPIVDFKCTSPAGENVLITFKKEAYEALGEPAELVMENFYTSIDSSALQENTNLKKITISSNITEIPWNAFSNCTSLTSVSMDEAEITKIGQYAFRNTKISEIKIPETVTTIEQSAFSGTQISILDIPDSVTELGPNAFNSCSNLTTVAIGSGIGSLENNPFSNCTNIKSYTIRRETPPTLGPEGLPGTSLKIYVPSSAVDTYKAAKGWSGYKDNIQAIE